MLSLDLMYSHASTLVVWASGRTYSPR